MTATILVVDDEPDLEALVLQKFRRQIRDGAVAFMFAHDGIEALQSIEDHPHVDMVVSDINMPRMDGLSLLQKLQEAEDKKSTIIVSAYGDMSNIRTAMNRGAFDFLTKPIDFGDLELTIDKTIRHVEMMREARMRHCRGIFRRRSPPGWPARAKLTAWRYIGARSRPSSPTSPALRRWWRPRHPKYWGRCSMNMWEA
jgi:DNA-binding NtrC family response regulator